MQPTTKPAKCGNASRNSVTGGTIQLGRLKQRIARHQTIQHLNKGLSARRCRRRTVSTTTIVVVRGGGGRPAACSRPKRRQCRMLLAAVSDVLLAAVSDVLLAVGNMLTAVGNVM
jgi:hypothetical protein